MRFIAEHALPLGLTLTGACIALALVQYFFSPRESKKFVANALVLVLLPRHHILVRGEPRLHPRARHDLRGSRQRRASRHAANRDRHQRVESRIP
jgi:hypothetical protein